MEKKLNLLIISNPFPSELVGKFTIAKYLRMLTIISKKICLLTGVVKQGEFDNILDSDVYYFNCSRNSTINSIVDYYKYQTNVFFKIFSLRKKYEDIIIFLDSISITNLLLAKLINKNIYYVVTGFGSDVLNEKYAGKPKYFKIIVYSLKFRELLNYYFADKILVYSSNMRNFKVFRRYMKKTVVCPEHYVDFNKFKVIIDYSQRDNIIGFVGRLSPEKGIKELIESIAIIDRMYPNFIEENRIKFMICGGGDLYDDLLKIIKKNNLDFIDLLGWIDNDNLPIYLNKMKYLILPSYTEGLPHVILESMACGVPPIATAVGSIPEIIENGRNGFILENNKPDYLANKIVEMVVNLNEGNVISSNAVNYVKCKYDINGVARKYLETIYSHNK